MTTGTTPEIDALKTLLTKLSEYDHRTQVLAAIESCWPSTDSHRLVELMGVVASLDRLVVEIEGKHARATAERTVSAIRDLFTAQSLSRTVAEWRAVNANQLHLIDATIGLFGDLRTDREAFAGNVKSIEAVLEEVSIKFNQSDLSDASKSVLMAQIELLRKSIARFEEGAVGPFRDQAYSVVGRVVIQIQNDPKVADVDKRKLIDDALRIYDVIDKGSSVLKLAAPYVAGLLTDMTTRALTGG